MPDLTVAELSLSETEAPVGESLVLSYTIKNVGGKEAMPSVARIYDGERSIKTVEVGELDAGETKSGTLNLDGLAVGMHTMRVVVDATGVVEEGDESNNDQTASIEVYERKPYTVHFDANGGTGSMPDQSFVSGTAGALAANVFSNGGDRYFKGWATTADGNVEYADGEEVCAISKTGGSVTLYAVWGQIFQIVNGVLIKATLPNTLRSVTIPGGVMSIGDGAFFMCTNLTQVTIPEGVTRIGDRAFEWCDSLTSVTLPSTVTYIGYEAFYECRRMTYVTIPDGVTSIGEMAFRFCSSLSEVRIPSSVTYIGPAAFANCGAATFFNRGVLRRVIFDGNSPQMGDVGNRKVFKWDSTDYPICNLYVRGNSTGWRESYWGAGRLSIPGQWTDAGVLIDYYDYIVDFDPNGGAVTEGENYYGVVYAPRESRPLHDGATVGELPVATRVGFEFNGWFTAAKGGKEISADTVVTADVTYYAHWMAKSYTVKFDAKGGSGGQESTMTYGSKLGELPTPSRTGYIFAGWWTATSGGEQVTAVTKVTSSVTYYAHWTASTTYKVTFDKNGGTGGDSYVTATYGAAMPTPRTAPKKDGYFFDGYWDTTQDGGKQYYDGNMKSVRNWDKASATTLWAKWRKPAVVKVTFGKNGGTGGDDYVTATEGKPMPTPRTAPKLSGWTFAGYWDTLALDEKGNAKGKQYYDANMKSVRNWDKATAGTLWAKWTNKVTFGKNGGTGGDDYVTCTKGQPMPMPRTAPKRTDWTFDGYWDTLACDASGNPKGKQYYDKDMKSVRNWDKTSAVTLWAKWTVRVKLGKNGGTGGDDYVTVTYNQPFPKRTMPKKSGYTFGGYFMSASSKTGQCYNADGTGTASMKWSTGGTPTIWALWTKTSACVELPPAVAPSASAAPAPAEPAIPAGIYSGVLADGTGAFWLMLDEPEEGCDRTAYLYVASEDGVFTAECTAEEAGGALLLTTEDGEFYAFDPAAGTLAFHHPAL